MAHFAKINSTGEVEDVVVLNNADILDSNGLEVESLGIDILTNSPEDAGEVSWVQTSYNNSIRGMYATIGGSYDSTSDTFRHAKPFSSWVWGTTEGEWVAPVAKPAPAEDVFGFELESIDWDENSLSWAVSATPWAHYARYNSDGSYEGTTVSMPLSYILDDNSAEDDELGVILALDYKGVGDWQRVIELP